MGRLKRRINFKFLVQSLLKHPHFHSLLLLIKNVYIIILYYNNRMEKKKRKIKNIRTYYLSNEDFELQEKIEDIAYRERVNVSSVVVDALKEYLIKHGDGNPVYTLDQFSEHDEMKAVPAVFRDRGIWDKFLHECGTKLRQEVLWQSQTIGALASKWGKND